TTLPPPSGPFPAQAAPQARTDAAARDGARIAAAGGPALEAIRLEARGLTDQLKQGSAAAGKGVAASQAGSAAARRRDLLKELAERDPLAVLDLALQPAERARVPDAARALVEAWVTLEGELRVKHED